MKRDWWFWIKEFSFLAGFAVIGSAVKGLILTLLLAALVALMVLPIFALAALFDKQYLYSGALFLSELLLLLGCFLLVRFLRQGRRRQTLAC